MTVRWTVRAANDRASQRESRFPQGVPKKRKVARKCNFSFCIINYSIFILHYSFVLLQLFLMNNEK